MINLPKLVSRGYYESRSAGHDPRWDPIMIRLDRWSWAPPTACHTRWTRYGLQFNFKGPYRTTVGYWRQPFGVRRVTANSSSLHMIIGVVHIYSLLESLYANHWYGSRSIQNRTVPGMHAPRDHPGRQTRAQWLGHRYHTWGTSSVACIMITGATLEASGAQSQSLTRYTPSSGVISSYFWEPLVAINWIVNRHYESIHRESLGDCLPGRISRYFLSDMS